jgi:ABC-type polysaccharide/polyol phosphate export permease
MAANGSFYNALKVQTRVIGALMMWEMITRFGRDNLGFIWLFLEPMIFTLGVTALWAGIGLSKSSSLPIVAFALTGYSSVLLWRNCASRCSMAVVANAGLLYHRPVRALDVLLTKILLEVGGASISFVALSMLWTSIGWAELPRDFLLVLAGWGMLIWFSTGLALIVGALTTFSELAERLWHPASYLLFPLSGAVFMVDWLGEDFRQVVLWIPIVHCVELIREGYFGDVVHTHYDMQYVFFACLGMTAAGLALVRAAGRRVNFR